MTQQQIADRLGCTRRTIAEWFSRHGIEARKGRPRRPWVYYETHSTGYEHWQDDCLPSRGKVCKVHRLAAVAWFGWDAIQGKHVHHDNGIPWDNREENLELLTPSEHMKHHHETEWDQRGEENHNAKLTEDDVRRIRECRGLVGAEELANEFDVGTSHIRRIWHGEAWASGDSE